MDICFWCKRQKDEGNGKPEYFNYEFCPECKKHIDKGIVIIQTVEKPNGNPPINNDLYPTGKWVVVREERIREVLGDWVGLESVLRTGTMYMDIDTWKKFKLPN